MMHYEIYDRFKNDLLENEKILWAGQPAKKASISPVIIFVVIFGVIWTLMSLSSFYFAFIEFLETGFIFPVLFLLIFVIVGPAICIFIIYFARGFQKYSYYILTDKRVLTIVDKKNNKMVQAEFFKNIPNISKKIKRNGIGTLVFGNNPYAMYYGNYPNQNMYYGQMCPVFYNIDEAERVYIIAYDIWKKSQSDS